MTTQVNVQHEFVRTAYNGKGRMEVLKPPTDPNGRLPLSLSRLCACGRVCQAIPLDETAGD